MQIKSIPVSKILSSLIILLITGLALSACVPGTTTPEAPIATITSISIPMAAVNTPVPTPTKVLSTPTLADTATQPASTPSKPANNPTPTSGPTPTLGPDSWKAMPVIPTEVSKRVQLVYQMGLINGNNPKAYSKIGDCNTTNPYFMTDFDTPGKYNLGQYTHLQGTVDYFAGSHGRASLAAKQGLTAHAVLSMLWVDWKSCTSYETPLTCEFRVQKPLFAIISFGTNDANGNVDFEKAMRRVLDMTIGNGTVPILATKADNAEGDNAINQTIVKLAYEYGLPLWNYWAAVQPLDNHGLDPERNEHLVEGPKGFANFEPDNLKYSWPVRNLTALQTLDFVRRALEDQASQ